MKSSGCDTQSYYECFANQVKLDHNISCVPKSLPSIGKVDLTEISFCRNETEEYLAWNHMYETIYYSLTDDLCPKLCTIEEYHGRIDYKDDKTVTGMSNYTLVLYVRYGRPYKMSVSREYLVYDFIGMVGSVGGTLGMFIGFSFYEVINKCCESSYSLKWQCVQISKCISAISLAFAKMKNVM